VEGLGGSQFAVPGAIDRLRAPEGPRTVTLAAADPANPYGAALPWPEHGRPSRTAGASVVLHAGRLTAFVERGGRRITTFDLDDEGIAAAAGAVADLAATKRRMTITEVDGEPAEGTALGRALVAAGFVESYKGLRRA
jgi:ATP-dependent Lhr-like helicase